MKILEAEFITSCTDVAQCPRDALPEFACVGRSNVGKSSLINALLGRRSLAKVSRTPGKTRLLNFFRISTSDPSLRHFYLVDVPGYGYARVSKGTREEWGHLMERYFTTRAALHAVLLLVDARVVQEQDASTYQWLVGHGHAPLVVVTKIDKLRRGERASTIHAIRRTLGLSSDHAIVGCSAVTGEGIDQLWQRVRKPLQERDRRATAEG